MDRLLRFLLTASIRRGSIVVTTASGMVFRCGDGTGPPISIRFKTPAAVRRLIADPELAFGELYTEGLLVLEQGSIADLLGVIMEQPSAVEPRWAKGHALARRLSRRLAQFNRRARSRSNVAHHYDLDGRLYALFLDADRQ